MVSRTARATVLGILATVLMGAATWWLLRTASASWPGLGPVEVDTALGFLTTSVAGLVAGWVTVLLAAATTSLMTQARQGLAVPGRRGLSSHVAAGLLVAAGLGAVPATAAEVPTSGTVAGSTLPAAPEGDAGPTWAAATTGQEDDMDAVDERDGVDDVEELPLPGWTPTVTGAEPVRRAGGEVSLVSTAAATPTEDEVVVHRGDTLWDIAARHLGEHATDQDVAEAWPRWYAANQDVIGSDPDLIHPGQRLVVPAHGGAR